MDCSWNCPGQSTGVGSISLLQGIFPTQNSNPGLPHCRQILHQLSHKVSARILAWVGYPFSSESSRPKSRMGVSRIAGGFFTNWAIRELDKQRVLGMGRGDWRSGKDEVIAVLRRRIWVTCVCLCRKEAFSLMGEWSFPARRPPTPLLHIKRLFMGHPWRPSFRVGGPNQLL